MKQYLAIFAFSIFLTACSTEILLIFKTLRQLNEVVCSEAHEETRKKLIEKIRAKQPDYPEEGLCAVEQRILDEVLGK